MKHLIGHYNWNCTSALSWENTQTLVLSKTRKNWCHSFKADQFPTLWLVSLPTSNGGSTIPTCGAMSTCNCVSCMTAYACDSKTKAKYNCEKQWTNYSNIHFKARLSDLEIINHIMLLILTLMKPTKNMIHWASYLLTAVVRTSF